MREKKKGRRCSLLRNQGRQVKWSNKKYDTFSNLLSLVAAAERGAGWHEYPVHWPVLPPSGHRLLLFRDKTNAGGVKIPGTEAIVLG